MDEHITPDTMDVSVIIPMYNSADTITLCLDSIADGEVLPKEVIVIDDGSIDASVEVVASYIRSHALPVRLLIQPQNGGQSKARNRGMNEAKGSYIAFLDSDDCWLPHKLKIQQDVLRKHPQIALLGARPIDKSDGRLIEVTKTMMLYRHYFLTSSVILKREALGHLRFDEKLRFSEDTKLWFDVIEEHPGAIISDNCYYLQDNSSQEVPKQGHISSAIHKMEWYELICFTYLFRNKRIGLFHYLSASIFSILKYLRRCLLRLKQDLLRHDA